MIEINGYEILTQIYESINSTVYRGIRQQDNQAVILKFLKEDYPTPSELVRYKQEYEITRNLNLDGVIKAYELKPYQRTLCIILEDFGASSLKHLMDERRESATGVLPLQEFLSIAIKTAEILSSIHAANIVHKDINPGNIIFNPEIGRLKIIDFGISTKFTRENPTLKNPNVLEGTLAYISPEQTGRMNRSLDYRTDFYSLGATFYELLTGQLPFETNDALELVHCHIAKVPISPHQLNPEIPQPLSDIVMKLMAKTAEERYQSAFGIRNDLAECLHQLQTQGNISEFPLGSQDISGQFHIPQKLYGREAEVEALLTAFERVADNPFTPLNKGGQGGVEMMLVAGYSGIGKSSLVAEIHKPNTKLRGYFTAGKFDQFQKNVPYSAVVNAFKGLVQQLLTESEEQLAQWREKLKSAFGMNGQVIIDVIPEVELIVGKQPEVPELGATESQNRFNILFQNFIRAFCTKEHPLVIFLDDLQWADAATLKLIILMMTDTEMQYLFLIGAYRDNEVSPTHPLMMTLDGLLKEGAIINYITLAPLGIENISQLIGDTLSSNYESVKSLAELVIEKTGGNPFFVNEFLKTLYSKNLIQFDLSSLSWQWDVHQIQAKGITDNVVELMIDKVNKLPESTQQMLRLAACVGANFNLHTLSLISEKSPRETSTDLALAIQSGLILPTSELDADLLIQDYKFLHDRVQQAAYAMIYGESKRSFHLKIGLLLLQNLPKNKREIRIFEIVDHLNFGRDLIADDSAKIELARLNLEAGKKAKDATAYGAALQYLRAGLKCLIGDFWTEYYELTLALHKERAEVEYLNGCFEDSEALIDLILKNVKSDIEKAEIYNLLLVQYTMSAKYEESIQTGKKALFLLGVDLPDANFKEALDLEVARAKKNLGSRKIADLIDEPEITDPQKRLVLKLLTNTDPPAYFFNQEMYAVIVLKMANISLQYGNIAVSSKGFVTYGMILGSILGDYQSGYEFGKLAVEVSKKFNSSSQRCSACLVLGGHLNNWVKHIKLAEAILNESYQAGLESGELLHSGYAIEHKLRYLFYQGKNLEPLVIEVEKFLQFNQKIKNQWAIDGMLGFQITLFNLSSRTPNKFVFCNNEISDEEFLESCKAHKSLALICTFYIFKSQVLYLYDQLHEALNCALKAKEFMIFTLGQFQISEHNFYTSLILVSLYLDASESEQKHYWEQLESQQEQMKIWADNCPENFLHKYLLVEAEIARISGQGMEALDLYDRAIASAHENEYIQNEALGNELVAKFWLGKGKEEIAKLYMRKAHYGYQLWGAKRKVEDLEQKYPQLIPKVSAQKQIDVQTTAMGTASSTSGASSNIDLSTVIKASQVLAGEIASNKLLEKLMTILMKNGGAQKGFLVLSNKEKLTIEARGEVDKEQVEVWQSSPIESSDNLPVGMIKYVARTQEDVVLSEATKEGIFTSEPYIIKNQPKSVLCAPIINQGKLIGILYLENNLTTGAFTPDRLEVLKILSSQAAISIENARLYQNLEDKVQERTAQLAEANQEISTLNQKLKAENVRMSAELDIVKQLQQMVLPKPSELEAIEGLEIAGFMEPADEVGGDYYDVLQQDGQVKISIGDVTGHGLESGVLMIMAQTAVRTLQKMKETDPVKFLDVLNQTLYDNLQRMDSSRNMSLAILDYAGGVLKLSGQHEEMIVVRADGKLERIDTMDLGFPIGLVEEIGEFIASSEVQLNPGDVVVLYTDGIPEAFDINKAQYGLERLWQVVVENRQRCAQEIREAVIDDVRQYIGTQKVFDDITLVVMKQK
ncbi:AAA family ATPase [Microcoleus sp. T2B6]|uniref:SpoIIE family protein phosphatase n=1 Tax=Microcoleus sp. T2B6 TaxID=3055424 RepID=UPI002FD0A0E4